MVKLPDPQTCKHCGQRGKVISSRPQDGFIVRRRQCEPCNWRWNSYETVIDPRRRGQFDAEPCDIRPIGDYSYLRCTQPKGHKGACGNGGRLIW